jgi:hypothetical protein
MVYPAAMKNRQFSQYSSKDAARRGAQGVSMNRHQIDPETKMVAILKRLGGEGSMADICRRPPPCH